MQRGSIQPIAIMLWTCSLLASLFVLAAAKPPAFRDSQGSSVEDLQRVQDDVKSEVDLWTPQDKNQQDKPQDSWQVFKPSKPSERRKWWEEDWHEDQWWNPKGSDSNDNNNVDSLSKTTFPSKPNPPFPKKNQGESQDESVISDDRSAENSHPQEAAAEEEAPRALPLTMSRSNSLEEDQSGFVLNDNSDNAPEKQVDKKVPLPIAESPREKVGHKEDMVISPFEDPKPGPYNGARGEAPSQQPWEYHQLTGFGKYIDQGKKEEEQEQENESSDDLELEDESEEERKEEEFLKEKREHMEEEIEEKERDRVVVLPEEDKQKMIDQFYGFGLESRPGAPALEKSTKLTGNADKPIEIVKKNDNYNKGIIYDDVAPGSLELTHSVKKDLVNSGIPPFAETVKEESSAKKDHFSVKKDLSKEYSDDSVSTKASLGTSPNPPPPDLAEKKEPKPTTTTVGPSPQSDDDAMFYIKSHPLTFCKLDEECRKGRMCRKGMCVCLPSNGCTGHNKPVCGSDGKQYPSYCELHRTACVRHTHIKVDYTRNCFLKEHAQEKLKIDEENYKDHLIPQASSQSQGSEDDDDSKENDSDYSDNDDDDYDEDDYDYDDEDEQVKNVDDEDEDEDDEVAEWLKGNKKQVTLDSKKIVDYTNQLKKDSAKQASPEEEDHSENRVDPSPWDHVKEETGDEFLSKEDEENDDELSSQKAMALQEGGVEQDYQSDGGYKECTKEELDKFKVQLLNFHCKRFEEPDCKLEVKEERDYLTNLMFSYLDMDTDYQLSYQELKERQVSEHFDALNHVCTLTDLIWYDDKLNADGRLSLVEFEQAFSYLTVEEERPEPMQPLVSQGPVVRIIPTLATVGNGLELKCGLAADGANVVWRRQGVNIHDLANVTGELMVLDDGSLFFSRMAVHLMGNYSCADSTDPSMLQVHSLKVQMPPIVRVSPHSQIHLPKMNARIKCHAEGLPRPSISWEKNGVPIENEAYHYALEDHSELLLVFNSDSERDSGAYKCVAKNQAGTSEDVANVVIMKDDKDWGYHYSPPGAGLFLIFHGDGYTVYSADECMRVRAVHTDFGFFKFIPDNLDGPLRLCNDSLGCHWGQVVNVKDSFVYATQPDLNRVVVLETTKNWIPLQVISTDKRPVQLHYVEHLDQVWVVCWNNGDLEDSAKTILVIRDASKEVQHRSVHTQPVGNHFDQIQALFMPPPNDLRHIFNFAYVTHNGQQGLTKLDLPNMRYVKAVDLSAYNCVPQSLAFVPIGGHVVVQCVSPSSHQTLQLVLDYLTDAVVSSSVLSGRPYTSPDSRHLVTVDDLTGKVSVAGVNDEGHLEAAYEVTVSASISDVNFYPAFGEGYLLVLTSADDDDIITINLSTGKVAKLKGTNGMATSSAWHPYPVKRSITVGEHFSSYLMAPSRSSLAFLNMPFHTLVCENTEIPHTDAAVFVAQ